MQTILNTNNTPAGGDTPVSPSSGILLYIQLIAKQSKVNIELGTQTREGLLALNPSPHYVRSYKADYIDLQVSDFLWQRLQMIARGDFPK